MAQPNTTPKRSSRPVRNPNGNFWIWVILGVGFLLIMSYQNGTNVNTEKELTYSQFYSILKDNTKTHQIKSVKLTEGPYNTLKGTFANGLEFKVNIPQHDQDLIKMVSNDVPDFSVVPPELFWSQLFFQLIPFLGIFALIWFVSYRGSQMGNKIFAFSKSRAQVTGGGKVTFADVAGVDEAKEELQEVIEFLKDPKKFERLGGKIPKGVLLVGPPGTGKTLLAKAVAGEAGVPFFSLSGSDFVEMFVGVGASRVRDLFEQGRKAAKVSGKGGIIFIDEIDAVGRQRFAGIGGGNDEREQTLNALLVEMDGFNTVSGLILIAATNRPDTLDPALLRPGRFDRQIVVGLPDINGREGILKVHVKNIKLGDEVNLRRIAQLTVYFSGADLANVCNEAALLAARRNKEKVGMDEMLAAVERVTMGPEKKSHVTSKKEKEMTAYHEAGHALLSLLMDEVDTFTKVSIIPRGMAGGYTLTPPKEDKHYMSKKELKGMMVVLLGGMVGEEIYMNDTTTGVSNDLQKVAQIARSMVCQYGMSDTLDKLSFGKQGQQMFLGRDLFDEKDYSEETARRIDEAIQSLVRGSYEKAKKLLTDNHDKLDLLAKRLIEKETIDIEEARVLLMIPDHKLNYHSDTPQNP
ncbi:MAG: ATP-dependent zinc metalloprotease FtsH [Candidatus Omnitrophica bacterium]|nr:ATP-dependent zinc metalloprotease FtsH [Candidatus Omnitrophota bacterium]MDE2008884.1 ATP-dependent zinc metalloprotease FtsH [Candidatus Omnitrophota bacterium]MDE2213553.1 ATP-dependent zinc metalloprotease FtsH [Candidatus Omnitrophota bacterium]MDE2230546.1 ATP-dependent zinc metalloprotease FtsH [Candidatus Omnitrophota bacterium]